MNVERNLKRRTLEEVRRNVLKKRLSRKPFSKIYSNHEIINSNFNLLEEEVYRNIK